MKTMTQIIAALLLIMSAPIYGDAAAVGGKWLSGDGDGLIAVHVDGTAVSAQILGSPNKDPNRPKTDVHNPDPKLRDRPLLGLDIFKGFTYDGNGEWSGGTIYDPNSGKTYSCKLKLVDPDTLKVRGYLGISLIGRTETWKRLAN